MGKGLPDVLHNTKNCSNYFYCYIICDRPRKKVIYTHLIQIVFESLDIAMLNSTKSSFISIYVLKLRHLIINAYESHTFKKIINFCYLASFFNSNHMTYIRANTLMTFIDPSFHKWHISSRISLKMSHFSHRIARCICYYHLMVSI